ncbi:MAG: cupin domain-containing protein [Pseudomonadota bacterium]|nr:cupin domain-containing protein [Pseudomonadota bacterium]
MKRMLTLSALALTLAAPMAMAQSIEVTKAEDLGGRMGPAETFTGTVYVEPVFPPYMGEVSAGHVTFMPGARSAWHTHPAGQILVITGGTGWVQERGQDKIVVQAGDVVWFPADIDHWHGATDTTSMTHYALQQGVDGSAVTWGDHVTDEEYDG